MITPMVSLELSDEDKLDMPMPMPMASRPDFPCGLRICLTHDELDKLDIDYVDASAGDIFQFVAMARITSKTETDGPDGKCCRIEAQIEAMHVADLGDA